VSVNTWYDTFVGTNGTVINGGAYTANSGGTYSEGTGQGSGNVVIESDVPYSSITGFAGAVYSQNLQADDPVQLVVVYSFAVTGESNIRLLYRIQSNGSGYAVEFFGANSGFEFIVLASGGSATTAATYIPSSKFAGGTYTLTAVPTGIVHEVYWQNSSNQYWNPLTAAFQTAKIPVLSWVGGSVLSAGAPGFVLGYQSSLTSAPNVTSVSGGPLITIQPDLGCSRSLDTKARLNCKTMQGGLAPIAYNLQRSPHGANTYVTIGQMAVGGPYTCYTYYDTGLTASTSYDYRVAAVDSSTSPQTTYSNVVTITTTATLSITGPTLTVPGTPYTIWTNGPPMTDAGGTNSLYLGGGGPAIWDDETQLYYRSGINYETTISGQQYVPYVYASKDQMNWTNCGQAWSTGLTVNSVAYGDFGENFLAWHPSTGLYYLIIFAEDGSSNYWQLILSSTVPQGPYTTYVGRISVPHADQSWFVDYDGQTYSFLANAVSGASINGMASFTVNSTWTAFSSITAATGNWIWSTAATESPSPFRCDRLAGLVTSQQTGYAPNANLILLGSLFVGGSTGVNPTAWVNASAYTTAAELLARPAGAYKGYSDGSSTGLNPAISYSTQCRGVSVTNKGQYIVCTDRWGDTTASGGPGATYNSDSYFLLPMSGLGIGTPSMPTIPFAASFVPSVQLPVLVSGEFVLDGLGSYFAMLH
jgi:hypothetical protein